MHLIFIYCMFRRGFLIPSLHKLIKFKEQKETLEQQKFNRLEQQKSDSLEQEETKSNQQEQMQSNEEGLTTMTEQAAVCREQITSIDQAAIENPDSGKLTHYPPGRTFVHTFFHFTL